MHTCIICEDRGAFKCDFCMGSGFHHEVYLSHEYSRDGGILVKEPCEECGGKGFVRCCK